MSEPKKWTLNFNNTQTGSFGPVNFFYDPYKDWPLDAAVEVIEKSAYDAVCAENEKLMNVEYWPERVKAAEAEWEDLRAQWNAREEYWMQESERLQKCLDRVLEMAKDTRTDSGQ